MKTKTTPTILNNEIEIVKVLIYHSDYIKVFSDLNRKMKTIFEQINYVIKANTNDGENLKIIFTANGNKKLFPKIEALKEHAASFLNWDIEFFIEPEKDIDKFKTNSMILSYFKTSNSKPVNFIFE